MSVLIDTDTSWISISNSLYFFNALFTDSGLTKRTKPGQVGARGRSMRVGHKIRRAIEITLSCNHLPNPLLCGAIAASSIFPNGLNASTMKLCPCAKSFVFLIPVIINVFSVIASTSQVRVSSRKHVRVVQTGGAMSYRS